MACYVIMIGGTGHRVGKAILHLAAAGAIPSNDLHVMCVDSDGANMDYTLFKDVVERYKKLSTTNAFGTSITSRNDSISQLCWSPLVDTGKMKDILSKTRMDDKKGQLLLNFLYTDFEQEKVLTEGFYGHTSIGSLFMAEQIMENGVLKKEWDDYLKGIQDGDRIFIIGSAFGGTGASGVPTISRILKDYKPNVAIAALLVMPYFKFNSDDEGVIDYTYFTTKTKAALSFYEKQNFNDIFSTLYLIGEDVDQFMSVRYSVGGTKQGNKPNAIELSAATALVDFLKDTVEEFSVKLMTRDCEGTRLIVTQDMINKAGENNSFTKLANLLRMSIVYTKYYHHHLCEGKSNGSWFDKYKGIKDDEREGLYNYCMTFINWIKDIHFKTNGDGSISPNIDDNIQLFKFSNDLNILFDGERVKKGIMGEKLKELDGICEIVFGTVSDIKGTDIITAFNSEPPITTGTPFSSFYKTLLKVCS